MQIRDWYVGQLVTEGEMDDAFADVEVSIRQGWSDSQMSGVISGFSVSAHTPNNLTVDVTGGLAVSSLGQRIYSPANNTFTVNCQFDLNGDPTAVVTIGNSRILSIVAMFDRALSDPRTDALSQTVYFRRDEYLSIEVVQGSEALVPTPPVLPNGAVRLANVTLTHNQTTITNLQIDPTAKQWMWMVGQAGPIIVTEGVLKDALEAIMTGLNDHVSGAATPHSAADVSSIATGFWADGTSKVTSTNVQDALDEIVSDLAAITGGNAGAQRIGVAPDANSPTTLAAGPLQSRLADMRKAENLSYAGSGNWADSSAIAATSIEGALDTIVSSLASTSGNGGAAKVGIGARSAWLGGRTNPSTHTYAAIDKIITDLAATTTSDDGAERIGAEAGAGFTSGSVRSQLDQIGPSATTTYTGAKTFDNITASAGNHYKVSSRSITRAAPMILRRTTGAGAAYRINMGDEPIDVSYTEHAVQELSNVPHAATITAVTFYHDRTDTGTLPFTRVKGSLWKVSKATGASTQIGIVTDPVSTLGAYNVYHSFSLSSLSEVVDRSQYTYYAQLDGETTPNDSTTSFYGVTVTFTVTTNEEAQ